MPDILSTVEFDSADDNQSTPQPSAEIATTLEISTFSSTFSSHSAPSAVIELTTKGIEPIPEPMQNTASSSQTRSTASPSATSPAASQTLSKAFSTSATTTGGGGSASATTTGVGGSSGGGGGLSHSGEIGVGVGVALGGVFAATVAWLAWKKWRARRSPEYSPPELYHGSVEQGNTEAKGGTGGVGNGTEVTKGSLK